MRKHRWEVDGVRWERDPDGAFHVWEEKTPTMGRAHALWVAESMVRRLEPQELIQTLNQEGVAEELRISFKVRIEERGAEYRVSIVPRKSGEFRRQE
jgi:hypothetical protein